MAREKLTDELKKAIKALPDKEKDKLLLRLIPTNEILVRQLEYKLIEESKTKEERRYQVEDLIYETMNNYPEQFTYSIYLQDKLRLLSSKISRHVRITSDKMGDIELNLLMIKEALVRNLNGLKGETYYTALKFSEYVCKRLKRVNGQIDKLHEDYRLEFQEDLDTISSCLVELPHYALVEKELSK